MQDNNNFSNKKTLLVALVVAIILGIFAYTQIKMNKANNKPKEIEEEKKEELNTEDLDVLDYVDEPVVVPEKKYAKIVPLEKNEKKEEVLVKEDNKETVYYTLTFNTNGGEEIEKQVLTNNDVTTTVIPTKESWIFDGWFTDSELTEPFIFGGVLKEDTTIYAKWVKYVKFVNEDFCIKTITAREDEIIALPTDRDLIGVIEEDFILNWFYVKEGFNKIYITNSTKLSDLDEDSDTVTLYLEKIPAFYLSFYLDENSDEFYRKKVINNQVISFDDVDEKLKEINPEIDLTTVGWYYYDIDGNKCDFSKNKTISTDITKIYLSDTYKIIYSEEDDEKEEGLVQIDEQNVARDTKLTDILDPEEKDNKEFEGWFIIDNDILTDSKLEEGIVINRDMTVVGKWKTSSTESNEEMVEK